MNRLHIFIFRLKHIKNQWAPSLVVSIMRGLRARLLADPRITPAAIVVFDKAVAKTFDAATTALITK